MNNCLTILHMRTNEVQRCTRETSPTVIIASDKYKGTLTSTQVGTALRDGALAANPALNVRIIPIADGGDGSLDVVYANGWTQVPITTYDAWGNSKDTHIAINGQKAMIEVAQICGLGSRSPSAFEALHASSFGVGQAIRAALDQGATTITLAAGGSASSDGGSGIIEGLGGKILDEDGHQVTPGAAGLLNAATVVLDNFDPRILGATILIASDVENPLLGPDGAATVYGPQKGAGAEEITNIEVALKRWQEISEPAFSSLTGRQLATAHLQPSAGAAGGIGFGGFLLGGSAHSGAEHFLDLVGFNEQIADATLVITGEGKLDAQSQFGKGPAVVASRAAKMGIPVRAVVGSCTIDHPQWHSLGFTGVDALDQRDPRCATDKEVSVHLLQEIGAEIGNMLKQ